MSIAIIVEHLEESLGKWVLIEYSHASKLVGEAFLVTNLKPTRGETEKFRELLKRFQWTEKSVSELFNESELIILDPASDRVLKPEDAWGKKAVVIGGILGDHPPRGRTKRLLTSRFPRAEVRSLGRGQFSIDGACVVAHLVLNKGMPIERMRFIENLVLRRKVGGFEHEIRLPYRYLVGADGKPVISRELVEYLEGEIVVDETGMLNAGES